MKTTLAIYQFYLQKHTSLFTKCTLKINHKHQALHFVLLNRILRTRDLLKYRLDLSLIDVKSDLFEDFGVILHKSVIISDLLLCLASFRLLTGFFLCWRW